MKLYQFVISALLVVTWGAPAATADPSDQTTYTIIFNGTGLLPTAGSFTYDPDTQVFTNFMVKWNGTDFDLTSSANSIGPFPLALDCLYNSYPTASGIRLLEGFL